MVPNILKMLANHDQKHWFVPMKERFASVFVCFPCEPTDSSFSFSDYIQHVITPQTIV